MNYAHFCRLRECGSLGQFYRYLIVRVFITGLETRDDTTIVSNSKTPTRRRATTSDDGKVKKKRRRRRRAPRARVPSVSSARTTNASSTVVVLLFMGVVVLSRVRFKILAERLLDAFVRENAFSFETKHHTHVISATSAFIGVSSGVRFGACKRKNACCCVCAHSLVKMPRVRRSNLLRRRRRFSLWCLRCTRLNRISDRAAESATTARLALKEEKMYISSLKR